MTAGNPLVAKATIQLKNFCKAADEEPFQEKLWGDPQRERHPESIVMRFKWPRRRTAGDVMEHRRFHLEEAAILEKPADLSDHE
jgi:hypothetical protein